MQIVVRVFVALLALAGAGGAVLTGLGSQLALAKIETEVRTQLEVNSIDEILQKPNFVVGAQLASPQEVQAMIALIDGYHRTSRGIWFLYAAGGFALFGSILAACARGKPAAAILLAAPLGPAVILPPLALLFIGPFISPLPLAGLLALFIRSPQPSDSTPDEE